MTGALQSQSPADRRTTKLIAARQDVMTKSCRVNTGVTRLLKGRRSLARWLSDCRRLVCARAAPLPGSTSPTSFSFSRSGWTNENLAGVGLVPNARHVCELSHSSYFRDVCFLPCRGQFRPRRVRPATITLTAVDESPVGTFQTCQRPQRMSVYRGRPEVTRR